MSYLQKTEITKGSSIEIDLGSFQQIATFHSLFYYTKKFVDIDIIPTYLPSIIVSDITNYNFNFI